MNSRTIGLSAVILSIAVTMQSTDARTKKHKPAPSPTPTMHAMHKKPLILKAVAPSHPGPVTPH